MIPKHKDIKQLFEDNVYAIEFAQRNNLVIPVLSCPEDGYSLKQISLTHFKCRKKAHRKIYSSLTNTIFENLRIKLSDFFFLAYLWLCEVSVKSTLRMTTHSSETICRVFKLLRSCVAEDFENNEVKIGGPGVEVQLDESKFGKRKNHRGHRVEGCWVFGGVEVTEERKMFAVVVQKRDAKTLNEFILKHVLPGSIVITDGWKGYQLFKKNINFEHDFVNHSITFKNERGKHTNNVEGTWNGIKIKVKPQGRVRRKMRGYLFEFIWRRKNQSRLWDALIYAITA